MSKNKNWDLETLKKTLTKTQLEVMCFDATEPPFQNEYWNHHADGIYVDRISGKPLFSSLDKYDSKTGWPSFTKPIDENVVTTVEDHKLGVTRTEVRSASSDAHLGHVFDDGPKPTGKRFCMNSASLKFIPVSDLEKLGYGQYLHLFARSSSKIATALLGGGCFWGVEDLIRKLPGVIETDVGYAGGTTEQPSYEQVKTGKTQHAEVVQIKYDASKITYEKILEFFFKIHDPTTIDQQGNDVGSQYRSVIFYVDEEQKKIAELVKQKVEQSHKWPKPIVTQIVAAKKFWKAEDYHQDYLVKHPQGYTCHYIRP